ncbi:MAG: glutamate--tRNA ligase [Methyloligellaceae bacterium]
MPEKVVTRFAPSPTGFLHIGGARTALFNWLFARANDGEMRLRIEDTDRARSTDDAISAIVNGLKWLELDWDGETVFQFAGAERHREVAEILLQNNLAYRCYTTPEELAEMREKARAEGRPPVYDGSWRDRDPGDAPKDISPAIRLKTPREGETIIEDRVQGTVTFKNQDLDDFILLRSDGTPTYMLSVVVDDHDMGVSHIIRGDDHLTNAARQFQIYKAMDWHVPVFAHLPLIHGPDGAKLSKRHGALGIEAYRAMGYLPAALRNYLARLGWSHGDDEIISTEQLIEWFGLDAIGKSPARLDFDKMESVNGVYLSTTPDRELLQRLHSTIVEFEGGEDLKQKLNEDDWQRIETAFPILKSRAKTLVDLMEQAKFIYLRRPLEITSKSRKTLKPEAVDMLKELFEKLQGLETWTLEELEAQTKEFADQSQLKFGQVAQPLRAALTGGVDSPGIFDVLFILGKVESLNRIQDRLTD